MRSKGNKSNKSNKLFNMRGGSKFSDTFFGCFFIINIVCYIVIGCIYEIKKKNYKKKIEELKDTLINDGSSNTKTINTEYAKYGKGKQWDDYYDDCGSKDRCIFDNTGIRKQVDNLKTCEEALLYCWMVVVVISVVIAFFAQ